MYKTLTCMSAHSFVIPSIFHHNAGPTSGRLDVTCTDQQQKKHYVPVEKSFKISPGKTLTVSLYFSIYVIDVTLLVIQK